MRFKREEMKSLMKLLIRWINHFITFVLFALFLLVIFLVISTRASGGEPSIFGYQLKVVLSGSMEPEIKTGSIIAVKPVDEKTNFKPNDIITFVDSNNQIVTHRIVDVFGNGEYTHYVTKGDNNKHPDAEPVMAQNVIAQYSGFTIPYVGYFIEFAKSQKGAVFLFIVPGILLLIYAGFQVWSALKAIDVNSRKISEKKDNSTIV